MKYKNIYSAIHNIGHSFLSLMNYVDGGYVIDELSNIRSRGCDIVIDWLNNTFMPEKELTSRIQKSMAYYSKNLAKNMKSQNVDVTRIKVLRLHWPAKSRKYMWAEDDRGREYKIYISEIK
ncbi:hypothetical protein ACFL6B_04770 [Thermodesulfobacteriota bacterium]